MKSMFKLIILAVLLLSCVPVFAGVPVVVGQVGYGVPTATPIPTLSSTMLIVLSLLVATLGYRIMRQKEQRANRMMILSLLGVGTLTFGLTGIKMIHDAQAAFPSTPHSLGPALSGTADINDNDFNVYTNITGTVIRINSIVIDPGKCTVAQPDDPGIEECDAGVTSLADGEQCRVACVSLPPG